MKQFFLTIFCLAFTNSLVFALPDPETNLPYVQSGLEGIFYARCIPTDSRDSTRGSTRIYRVRKEQDELVDDYKWYSRKGVVLCWSPIAGKIAVLALSGESAKALDKQVELRFFLGGKFMSSYSTQDLMDWGAESGRTVTDGDGRPYFRTIGCEQIPGTNEYVFSIEIKERKISFDILTGKHYRKSGVK